MGQVVDDYKKKLEVDLENKISIVCPLYNKSGYISQTIESVMGQKDPNWELIIVDDGSTDGSYEIALSFCQSDDRVKLVKRSEIILDTKGANICRNLGIELASSDYLMFLDADDILTENCIGQRLSYLKRYRNHNMYIFNVAYCRGEDAIPYTKLRPSALDRVLFKFTRNKKEFYLKNFLKFNLPWHTSGPVWDKTFLLTIGGFDLKLQRLQDPAIHSKALLDDRVRLKSLMYESEYDVLHRKDDDRVVWTEDEFFRRQLHGINTYIKTFVPLLEKTGMQRYLYLLQGYFLEAEKILYRHQRVGGSVSDLITEELEALYKSPEYKKITTPKYQVFKSLLYLLKKNQYSMRFKVPGLMFVLYKSML